MCIFGISIIRVIFKVDIRMDKMLLFSTTIQGCLVDKNKLAAKELLPLKITFFPYCFIIFMHVHFSPFKKFIVRSILKICSRARRSASIRVPCRGVPCHVNVKIDEILLLSTINTFELFRVTGSKKRPF